MKRSLVSALLVASMVLPANGAEDAPGLVQLVQILRQEGLLDDEQYAQIVSRASARESRSWSDRIHLSGDLRIRYENFFFFNENADGAQQDPLHRARYRLRLDLGAEINDHAQAFLQLTTGNDPRSANQTLGSPSNFDPDFIGVRQAWVQLTPFAHGAIPGHSGWLGARAGKVPDPFVWQATPDFLLLDNDLAPEGLDLGMRMSLNEDIELFSNGGLFVLEQNPSRSDVTMGAGQIGGHWRATEDLVVGSRMAWFGFFQPDSAFVDDASSLGNVPGGFDGGGDQLHVVAGTAYLTVDSIESWPVTVFGTGASNLSARSALGAGRQDLAWQVGLQAGDKGKLFQAGLLYAHLEANAFPAVLVDDDLFDGFTNREGFALFLTRQVLTDTDLRLTLFRSRRISQRADPLGVSVPNANRFRMQADMIVAF